MKQRNITNTTTMNRTISNEEKLPHDAEAQLKHLQEVTKPILGKWPHSVLCSCPGCGLLETYSPALRAAAIHLLQTGEFPKLTQPKPELEPSPVIHTPLQTEGFTNSTEKETMKTSELPVPADPPQPSAIQVDFTESTPQQCSVPPQLPNEPAECYDAFLEYYEGNNARSIAELAVDFEVTRQTIYRYKAAYKWDKRIREHKQQQLAVTNAAIEPVLKETAINWANSMKELKALQWNLAKLQFQRAYAILSDASTECSIKDAVLMVQVASKIGQAAISDNTSTVQEDTGLTKFEQLVHEFAARQKSAITESDLIN